MASAPSEKSPRRLPAHRRAIAVAGMLALATAMGIGRFAFTPLLPMMLNDRVIDLASASWLASANYLGYLVGALLCTLQPWLWRRLGGLPPVNPSAMLRGGLVATSLLTLGMALQLPGLWPLLRFAAGVASAIVFVFTSGWCLAQLARLGAPELGGVVYTGPGVGIVLSGLFATGMVAWQWTAAAGWLIFGALATLLTAFVWPVFQAPPEPAASAAAAGAAPHGGTGPRPHRGEMALLAFAYGLAGFGYIITATFLPVIARAALPGSAWLDMFWPLFGLGVVAGALLSTRIPPGMGDLRHWLAGSYLVQALGVAASVWSPSLAGFALGSLMLGLPFTAITFFAMQEVRRLRPAAAASFMGLLTAVYGIGQIVGPPLVALLIRHSGTTGEGFTLSLEVAAATLLAGAVLYLAMVRVWPAGRVAKS